MHGDEAARPDLATLLALKERLPRTWPAFFERYGSFTAAQAAAIPVLLDGGNVMLCAPTAGGKTAAALAPLIERHCPPTRAPGQLRLLYLTPTRALVNDLSSRLRHPCDLLGLGLGVKTRDAAFRTDRPPDLLLSTPESVDSLLASQARLFAPLRAIVIDELHLFAGTPRGDQLRVILNRIRRVRAYAAERGDAPDAIIQYVALSATVNAPEATAGAYFSPVQVVQVPGGRPLESEQYALAPDSSAELLAYLERFRARGWRKALAFCNSRAEVEAYAAATRAHSPFGSAVYTHYSNLEPDRRREIEQEFGAAEAAICFASSTLELGIDIGTIDVVLLLGPPGSPGSFAQRIGRGNRRSSRTRVACFSRTPLEQLLFEALLAEAGRTSDEGPPTTDHRPPATDERRAMSDERRGTRGDNASSVLQLPNSPAPQLPFRPAVAVQQIFSLIKQSPTAAVRLAELASLFEGMLAPADLEQIVAQLVRRDYLQTGRPGEWRAGPRLNKLYDEQTGTQVSLSIYSNIQVGPAPLIAVRDQHTQRVVARVDSHWLDRDRLTLEGRPVSVEWCDGEALWVTSYQGTDATQRVPYRSGRQLLSYELARLLPAQLGLPPGTAPFVEGPDGWWWFHWLGDLYGQALLDLLRYRTPARETTAPGLAVETIDPPQALPAWSEAQVVRYLSDTYRQYESLLDLGSFQQLLPVSLRRRAVVEQFGVARFLAAVAELCPVVAPEALIVDLAQLLV